MRKHETPGSETKDFITHSMGSSMSSILVLSVPSLMQVTQMGPEGSLHILYVIEEES